MYICKQTDDLRRTLSLQGLFLLWKMAATQVGEEEEDATTVLWAAGEPRGFLIGRKIAFSESTLYLSGESSFFDSLPYCTHSGWWFITVIRQ